jgi:hypothetical protein
MNIVDEILRFFVSLFRNRIDNAEIAAKSRMLSAEARLKTQVANRVNQGIGPAIGQGKSAVQGQSSQPQGRQPHPAAAKKS